jgi:mitogen-activated protein kinase organizer 1
MEQLPHTLAVELQGHEGAALAVRFNRQGTYCLSCGKVCH